MRLTGLGLTSFIIATLHAVVLSLVFGTCDWWYLLVTVISGATLWGLLPAVLPLRRGFGLLLGAFLAVLVQQTVFWYWRSKLGGPWWPLVQFGLIHILIGTILAHLRYHRRSVQAWRDMMSKDRQRKTNLVGYKGIEQ